MRFRENSRNAKPSKRSAVRTAYYELLKLFQQFNIPHMQEVSGIVLVRICCRTFDQLNDIASATKIIFGRDIISEIGMPLEHNYKFKTLVLYLKPIDESSSNQIYDFFTQRNCNYNVLLVNSSQSPTRKNSSTSSETPNSTLVILNPILNLLIIMMFLFIIQYFVRPDF